ncbi:sulfatase-like hydrolase/transferase [Enterococcus sp. LJL98]
MTYKNILFLVADDQRFDTIAALGNPDIQTPNFDRLVENGVAFEEAYLPGGTSGAVCMPSRAMIHTGRYLTSWDHFGETIPPEQALLGETLKENGYQTCGIGKWHNGLESYTRSFSDGGQIFFGGMWDHWNVPVNNFHADGNYGEFKTFTQDPFSSNRVTKMPAEKVALGKHSTDLFTDEIIDYLQNRRKKDQPFFIYGSFLAPHDPRTMPEKYQKMYDPAALTLPDNFLPQHPFGFDIQGERDETLEAYPRTEAAVRQHLADYYAMISHIDERVGDLIETLEAEGLLDETLIVFTGDNGLSIGQHGLMGKQNLYDHSIRVPLLISGPGLPKNQQIKEKVLLLDIMPTLLDYVGLPVPEGLYGKSFLPIIQSGAKGREVLYLMFTTKIRGLVTKDYKYLEYRTKDGHFQQLFDRKNDPFEKENLAKHPANQPLVAKLQAQMFELAKGHQDLDFHQGREYWAEEISQKG